MAKVDFEARTIVAGILSVGTSAMDSIRVMAVSEMLRKYPDAFTPGEKTYIQKRNTIIYQATKELRELNNSRLK